MKLIKKIFTTCLVISPILSLYGISSNLTVTLLDVALLILLPIMILINLKNGKVRNKSIYYELIPYLIYIIIQFLILSIIRLTPLETIDIGLRTVRYSTYLIVVIFFVRDYFDYSYGKKVFKYFVIFSTIYFFIQLILLRGFNFYLKGYVEFLPVLRENLIEFSETATNTEYTRVRSIFGEISQYSICLLGYLSISLFGDEDYKERKVQFFLTLGLLLSVSSIGVIGCITLWIIWICLKIKDMKKKINPSVLILCFFIIIGLITFLFFSESFDRLLARIENSSFNRFGPYMDYYKYIKEAKLSKIIFGHGMNTAVLYLWYPSFAKMLRFFGFIGTSLFFVSIIYGYIKVRKRSSKVILLGTLVFLGIGTEILIGNLLLLYYPFFILNDYTIKK